jgi:hypothetical protein
MTPGIENADKPLMRPRLHKAALTRFAVRLGLGATLTAGVVALALPGGAAPVALALGAGGLVALSGLGAAKRRPRVTAPKR